MTRLSLWPEWGRKWPVWGAQPSGLAISADLRRRLEYWALIWNVNWGDRVPRWSDEDLGDAWIAEGNALLTSLREELGSDYTVEGSFDIYKGDQSASDR